MEEKKLDLNSIIGFVLIFGILIWMMYQNQPSKEQLAAEKAKKEQAASLTTVKVANASGTLNQIDTVTSTDPIDYDQLQLLDAKFHLTIVGIAGNRFINQTLNVLQDVMRMSMETTLKVTGRSEISRIEHNEILEAIENGDGDLAAKLTLKHITGARKTAIQETKNKDEQ
jgi:GntR family transcriptional repressor for pyruvate dehydrogenase complex